MMKTRITECNEFFHQTVEAMIASLLVSASGEDIYDISYIPYPESNLDQDPDKFDVVVEDITYKQILYKFSFDRKIDSYADFLKKIVEQMTEGWD